MRTARVVAALAAGSLGWLTGATVERAVLELRLFRPACVLVLCVGSPDRRALAVISAAVAALAVWTAMRRLTGCRRCPGSGWCSSWREAV